MLKPSIFPDPDQHLEPFIPPVGATAPPTEPGGPLSAIQPDNYSLFSTLAGAESLLPQYKQAAKMLGLSFSTPLTIVDITHTYPYARPTDNSAVFVVAGAVVDLVGNISTIQDIAGERLWAYVYPRVPGEEYLGDTNYKEEIPLNNGVPIPSETTLAQVPGVLKLVVSGGTAQGRWVAAA